ncbi:hypothetical protein E2C01_097982 [Portunus trituberculatus]|uniref:Uncharacterized protein n=1 Tax=Portunus trituberculatus TaxID=210409 RepID=A0A5B7K1S9_PORTR|nr:hypothetical protein [Portunus trituberculatus]
MLYLFFGTPCCLPLFLLLRIALLLLHHHQHHHHHYILLSLLLLLLFLLLLSYISSVTADTTTATTHYLSLLRLSLLFLFPTSREAIHPALEQDWEWREFALVVVGAASLLVWRCSYTST